MPILDTSDKVIVRTGIKDLPGYSDLIPITDVPGFAVRRAYPPDSDLARVVDAENKQLIKAIIQFMVTPPSSSLGVTAVTLRAWVFPRHKARKLFAGLSELPVNDPDAATPNSLQVWRAARKPTEVEIVGEFVYDAAEDCFIGANGQNVTPAEMLDRVYQLHLRTLSSRFVWSRRAESLVRWLIRQSVFRAQDGLTWLLCQGYDVELALRRERISPFHKFRFKDFMRAKVEPGGERSEFFGFVSSRKNLVTNLVVLASVVWVVYCYGPRTGLLQAIYRNDALTTGALLLGLFAIDYVVQFTLKALICGLSRLREHVMFLPTWVKP